MPETEYREALGRITQKPEWNQATSEEQLEAINILRTHYELPAITVPKSGTTVPKTGTSDYVRLEPVVPEEREIPIAVNPVRYKVGVERAKDFKQLEESLKGQKVSEAFKWQPTPTGLGMFVATTPEGLEYQGKRVTGFGKLVYNTSTFGLGVKLATGYSADLTGYEFSDLEQIVAGVLSMLDPATMATFGAGGKAGAKVGDFLLKKLVKNGVEKKLAGKIVAKAVKPLKEAGAFAAYGGVRGTLEEGLRQKEEGEFRPLDIIEAGAKGAGKDASLGYPLGITSMAFAGKGIIKQIVKTPAEILTLAIADAAPKGRLPTWKEVTNLGIMLLGFKLQGKTLQEFGKLYNKMLKGNLPYSPQVQKDNIKMVREEMLKRMEAPISKEKLEKAETLKSGKGLQEASDLLLRKMKPKKHSRYDAFEILRQEYGWKAAGEYAERIWTRFYSQYRKSTGHLFRVKPDWLDTLAPEEIVPLIEKALEAVKKTLPTIAERKAQVHLDRQRKTGKIREGDRVIAEKIKRGESLSAEESSWQARQFKNMQILKGRVTRQQATNIFEKFTEKEFDQFLEYVEHHRGFKGKEIERTKTIESLRLLKEENLLPPLSQVEIYRKVLGDKFANSLAERHGAGSALNWIADIMNVPRTALASFDVSYTGRQGYRWLLTQPKYLIKNLPAQFRALARPEAAAMVEVSIKNHPFYELAMKTGLELVEMKPGSHHLIARPEEYQTTVFERLAGMSTSRGWSHLLKPLKAAGMSVAASNRAFATLGNLQRTGTAFHFYRKLIRAGFDPKNPEHLVYFEGASRLVNYGTGRGATKFKNVDLKAIAPFLNALFFAPKMRLGTWQFYPRFFIEAFRPGNTVMRVELAKHLVAQAMVKSLIGGLAMVWNNSADDYDVEYTDNPTRPDWGRLVLKEHGTNNKHVLGVGVGASVDRMLARIVSMITTTADGKTKKTDLVNEIAKYLQTGLSPPFAVGLGLYRGKTMGYEDPTVWNTIEGLTVPIFVQTIIELAQQEKLNDFNAWWGIMLELTGGSAQYWAEEEEKPKAAPTRGSLIRPTRTVKRDLSR